MSANRLDALPIGRRVAYWRGRRRLSQQVLADRLGKSKSWVDKVERGVRSLDRVSTIEDIARVLRIDTAVLLGRDTQPPIVVEQPGGVDLVGAVLSAYDTAPANEAGLSVGQVAASVQHAWTAFQHGRYPQVVTFLPGLLTAAQRVHADDPVSGHPLLVEVYRVTAAVLLKLGVVDLAWLAADRAMTVAAGDRVRVAAAAVQLGQVLRAAGRSRVAVPVLRKAAYRIAPPDLDGGPASEVSLCGTLLVQAALSAAGCGDDRAAAGLLGEAADLAARVGDGHDHHRTGFGPTAVDLARVTAAVDLGHADDAIVWHEKTLGRDGWRWLAAEHRAAHLVDAARAYLLAGDPVNAGRVLVDAERTAPAEIRHRPAAREIVAQVARDRRAPTQATRLATSIGVT
ncbi:helix-turn-helix domain-containing protein [Micromonospora echinofusca]|uniref:Helix-turn-helix domain-containing protein n=1 Tax=Micromonospora echinofusca TaxID=47858 RepID=A0ABS3VUL0_MICEH|nr:helix-turn-helix domain-containing protein [Micromonospora echinofusca]MBO4208201.1 helix-turn-helix domain-containing protein [Micromonospora echinofusca]